LRVRLVRAASTIFRNNKAVTLMVDMSLWQELKAVLVVNAGQL
ncbi:5803_t:CDS:1, partial [Acaulospora colombiana]